eukprot:GILJ01002653.1.p1 GENE.GILJ01002653.1~~GILJ01002653.1.p1  ORF type:complete len:1409 (-),score=304.33 GILJ01002653.1:99-4325(-)
MKRRQSLSACFFVFLLLSLHAEKPAARLLFKRNGRVSLSERNEVEEVVASMLQRHFDVGALESAHGLAMANGLDPDFADSVMRQVSMLELGETMSASNKVTTKLTGVEVAVVVLVVASLVVAAAGAGVGVVNLRKTQQALYNVQEVQRKIHEDRSAKCMLARQIQFQGRVAQKMLKILMATFSAVYPEQDGNQQEISTRKLTEKLLHKTSAVIEQHVDRLADALCYHVDELQRSVDDLVANLQKEIWHLKVGFVIEMFSLMLHVVTSSLSVAGQLAGHHDIKPVSVDSIDSSTHAASEEDVAVDEMRRDEEDEEEGEGHSHGLHDMVDSVEAILPAVEERLTEHEEDEDYNDLSSLSEEQQQIAKFWDEEESSDGEEAQAFEGEEVGKIANGKKSKQATKKLKGMFGQLKKVVEEVPVKNWNKADMKAKLAKTQFVMNILLMLASGVATLTGSGVKVVSTVGKVINKGLGFGKKLSGDDLDAVAVIKLLIGIVSVILSIAGVTALAPLFMSINLLFSIEKLIRNVFSQLQSQRQYSAQHTNAVISGLLFNAETNLQVCSTVANVLDVERSQSMFLTQWMDSLRAGSKDAAMDTGSQIDSSSLLVVGKKEGLEVLVQAVTTVLFSDMKTQSPMLTLGILSGPSKFSANLRSILNRSPTFQWKTLLDELLTGPVTDLAVSYTEEEEKTLAAMGFVRFVPVFKNQMLKAKAFATQHGKLNVPWLWACRLCSSHGVVHPKIVDKLPPQQTRALRVDESKWLTWSMEPIPEQIEDPKDLPPQFLLLVRHNLGFVTSSNVDSHLKSMRDDTHIVLFGSGKSCQSESFVSDRVKLGFAPVYTTARRPMFSENGIVLMAPDYTVDGHRLEDFVGDFGDCSVSAMVLWMRDAHDEKFVHHFDFCHNQATCGVLAQQGYKKVHIDDATQVSIVQLATNVKESSLPITVESATEDFESTFEKDRTARFSKDQHFLCGVTNEKQNCLFADDANPALTDRGSKTLGLVTHGCQDIMSEPSNLQLTRESPGYMQLWKAEPSSELATLFSSLIANDCPITRFFYNSWDSNRGDAESSCQNKLMLPPHTDKANMIRFVCADGLSSEALRHLVAHDRQDDSGHQEQHNLMNPALMYSVHDEFVVAFGAANSQTEFENDLAMANHHGFHFFSIERRPMKGFTFFKAHMVRPKNYLGLKSTIDLPYVKSLFESLDHVWNTLRRVSRPQWQKTLAMVQDLPSLKSTFGIGTSTILENTDFHEALVAYTADGERERAFLPVLWSLRKDCQSKRVEMTPEGVFEVCDSDASPSKTTAEEVDDQATAFKAFGNLPRLSMATDVYYIELAFIPHKDELEVPLKEDIQTAQARGFVQLPGQLTSKHEAWRSGPVVFGKQYELIQRVWYAPDARDKTARRADICPDSDSHAQDD